MSFLGDFISGEFVKPRSFNGQLKKLNPSNPGKILFDGGYKFDHINAAVSASKKSFKEWASFPLATRIEKIQEFKDILLRRIDELALIITNETGKPLWEAKREVLGAARNIDITVEEALPLIHERTTPHGQWKYKPRGVMAVISPFNFPCFLPVSHFVPALLTGNTIVFKPSELTPCVGQLLAEIMEKAQFPNGVFNMVQGNEEVGRRLAMHQDVEGILFTGSYETGFKIKQDTLTHFWKILALEMGGKNAAIVWDDCPFKKTIYETLLGSFITTGQRCTSTSRIIVRKAIFEKFIEAFHEATKNLVIDDPLKDPFMGPLVSFESQDRYLRFQNIAQRELAEPLLRGRAIEVPSGGYYVSPSINLVRKQDAESIYQKTELFGPNVAVYVVEELDDALSIVNSSSYGLALSVFTTDQEVFDHCLGHSRAGVVHWNKSTVSTSPHLPFGGMGKSGNNQPSGLFTVSTTTYPVSSIIDEPMDFDPSRVFPGMNFK